MVEVGAWGDTLFNPNHLNASVGDVIRFRFLKLNHTLTQSTLDHPCTPSGGFDSGFQFFNPLNQTNKTLTFIVQTTDPIWFFCHQNLDRPHCQSGMVFGLNPANKMSQFLANARSIVGTAVDYFPTGSAISYFPTGSSVGFPAPPPGITSVPPGVFYSGYAGMTNRSIGSYRTSPSAIASIASSFTQSGLPAPEVTSDGITTSTTSSAMIPSLRVSFKVLLSLSLVLVLI